ncbi:MAG: hypothetical protein K6F82_00515 [Sphaerochaetaceae bacterium]|nr:hypothetical protein [Sphaerochaetaceae bacterium]
MKKLLTVLLVLLISFCVFAGGKKEAKSDVDLSSLKIAAPSGAPAIGLAVAAAENPELYTFIAAETVTAEFANGTSDFIVAPINAGAKLYKMGKSTYKLAAVISWGNLFFASQKENFTLSDIDGADITMFGENTINSSIALYALKKNGITPASVSYLASAANTQQLLLSDPSAIVLTAEPALTAASVKNSNVTGYSVNEAMESTGFTQAGLFVKASLAENSPETVDAYLEVAKASCDKCTTDLETVANAAVELEILPSLKVALSAIPNCSINYVAALQAKDSLESTANIDLKQFGGSVPADDFYYGTK